MDWQNRIIINPEILVGKPVIKNTRLSVEFIIELLAQGWLEADILKNYLGIIQEDIKACLSYASNALKTEKSISAKYLSHANFTIVALEALQQQEHDVIWLRTDAPGSARSRNIGTRTS